MTNQKSSRLTVAVLLVAAVMLLAGGGLTASNMGFKANIPLVRATTGSIGFNWVALPFNTPYTNAAGLCSMTGLPNLATTIFRQDAATGASTTQTCGTPGALTLPTEPGVGWRIRSTSAALPASIIVVGSHNPSQVVTVPATSNANGNIGNLWFAVPYHTTAVNAQDICNQAGFQALRGSIQVVNPATGSATTPTCGTALATSTTLTLGRAVRLRGGDTTRSFSFTPAHF